jgi:hypothetical protein
MLEIAGHADRNEYARRDRTTVQADVAVARNSTVRARLTRSGDGNAVG